MKSNKVIDLFAGVGGMSLGFEMAGFEVVLANEYDKEIAEAYIKNHPNTKMIAEDITSLSLEKIFSKYRGKIDVIIGGPPCQGFSQKGQRKTIHDERNFLFKYYVKVVELVQPKYFVMENVPNLLTAEKGYFKKEVEEMFRKLGYILNSDVLNAADYGVPQNRRRAVIIGKKTDNAEEKVALPPKTKEQVTIWDAISDLAYLESGEGESEQKYKLEAQSMYQKDIHKVWLATGEKKVYLEPSMANRHGLIAGATGTGKTVTLKVLAESFSDMGVPVFVADIKGDLSGMCKEGCENKHIRRSIDTMGITDFNYCTYPVQFWDVYGKKGLPVRTTISEMGPDLLSRLLGLNDTQSGVLRIVFRVADDKQLLLVDLKDLKAMLQYVGDNAKEFKLQYGNVSAQTIGAIQRSLLALEDEGGEMFFGEPSLELHDWFEWDDKGRGYMNILECAELFQRPLLYGTFLLWMLSEIYDMLPEAGDLEKPKLAFFFDEAHLLFDVAPKALVD